MLRCNYILNGKNAVAEFDILKWAAWYEKADRVVKQTQVSDSVRVSTVFLGIDHGWNGVQMLFETMIFGGEHDNYQERYSTWEEAEAGHQRAIEMVFEVS